MVETAKLFHALMYHRPILFTNKRLFRIIERESYLRLDVNIFLYIAQFLNSLRVLQILEIPLLHVSVHISVFQQTKVSVK